MPDKAVAVLLVYTSANAYTVIWYAIMNRNRLRQLVLILLLALPLLSACGQKGDLYLPEQAKQQQAGIA